MKEVFWHMSFFLKFTSSNVGNTFSSVKNFNSIKKIYKFVKLDLRNGFPENSIVRIIQ